METIIEHFEKGISKFETEAELIEFTQKIYKENEGDDDQYPHYPEDYNSALFYLNMFCDNFRVISPKTYNVH